MLLRVLRNRCVRMHASAQSKMACVTRGYAALSTSPLLTCTRYTLRSLPSTPAAPHANGPNSPLPRPRASHSSRGLRAQDPEPHGTVSEVVTDLMCLKIYFLWTKRKRGTGLRVVGLVRAMVSVTSFFGCRARTGKGLHRMRGVAPEHQTRVQNACADASSGQGWH